jgi:hypothetical protein
MWRTKLRSTVPGVDHTAQVAHCVEGGVIGIGWRLDELAPGTSLEVVVEMIEKKSEPGWGRRAAQAVHRFGAEAQVGDFVWTRDTSGRYLLARISGPYRYDISEAAKVVDVHQVRAVEWAPRALNDLEVPGAVIRCFVGAGSSFSRIHDEGARVLTLWLWEKLHDRAPPRLEITPGEVLSGHLDPYDVEDLVYVWLQVARGYVVLPCARQRDTPAYEWTMIDRVTRRRAIAQIKTGAEPVVLASLASAVAGDATDTFAFATGGCYVGDPALVTAIIESDDLLAFVREHPDLLPERVKAWFELAGGVADRST